MRRPIAISVIAVCLIIVCGSGAFYAFYYGAYFGVWPAPSLEVDDPIIQAWLSSEDVVVHRQGIKKRLEDTTLYIQEGQRIDGGCRHHTILHLSGAETGARVALTLATNYSACERLVMEGTRPK